MFEVYNFRRRFLTRARALNNSRDTAVHVHGGGQDDKSVFCLSTHVLDSRD